MSILDSDERFSELALHLFCLPPSPQTNMFFSGATCGAFICLLCHSNFQQNGLIGRYF